MIQHIGEGMNVCKRDLNELVEEILNRRIKRVVFTQKDRLLRFRAEIVFAPVRLEMWRW